MWYQALFESNFSSGKGRTSDWTLGIAVSHPLWHLHFRFVASCISPWIFSVLDFASPLAFGHSVLFIALPPLREEVGRA